MSKGIKQRCYDMICMEFMQNFKVWWYIFNWTKSMSISMRFINYRTRRQCKGKVHAGFSWAAGDFLSVKQLAMWCKTRLVGIGYLKDTSLVTSLPLLLYHRKLAVPTRCQELWQQTISFLEYYMSQFIEQEERKRWSDLVSVAQIFVKTGIVATDKWGAII